jgi:hypothetical protein
MPKRVTNLDDFNKDVVCRTLLVFNDRRISISKKKITFSLKHKMGYQGSSSSTLRILKHLGFRYRNTNDRLKCLMKRSDIVAPWLAFLHTVYQIRVSGNKHLVFYLDEIWVNQNHTGLHK